MELLLITKGYILSDLKFFKNPAHFHFILMTVSRELLDNKHELDNVKLTIKKEISKLFM